MFPPTYICNKLYLTQCELLKKKAGAEVLPLAYNYQGLIVVTTALVEEGEHRLVVQTHSCGCGPQPTIRGGLLKKITPWTGSEIQKILAACGREKEMALSLQTLVDKVYVIKRPKTADDRDLITTVLKEQFGQNHKISFFF